MAVGAATGRKRERVRLPRNSWHSVYDYRAHD